MAIKKVILTQDGYDKLVEKLEYLKSVKRMEVADRLKAAIALGDLSENSEYDDAKNEQAFIEGEIIDLENKISNSEIIQVELTGDVVDIGSTVTIREVEELKKLYAKIKKLYRKEGEEAAEVADDAGSLDLLYRLSDSDFIELDSVKGERERLHRLITVTFEEVDSSDGSELYRVVDGGFVLADSDEAHTDKLYRIIEGQPLDLYGRVETLYRAYQYIDDAETYTIVGSTETNPDESRISNESPVGAALRGKKPGAIAEVHAPVGILLYEILEVK